MRYCTGFSKKHERVKIGEYLNETTLIRGRSITVRNVEVRECGCRTYNCMGPMLRLLQDHPRKRVVTWHPKVRKWK